jgi:acetyltransferase EpsM
MDTMKNINILSLGGISKIAIELLCDIIKPDLLKIYDDNPDLLGQNYKEIKIIGTFADVLNLPQGSYYFNGLGSYCYYQNRISISEKLIKNGLIGYNVHHISAIISSSATIGKGTFLAPNVNVGLLCHIGEDCVVFSNSTIEHDSSIGKLSYISPGVTICGKVEIGNYCYIGPGSIISAGVKIGHRCIVGAGSTVLKNLPDGSFAIGTPAMIIKNNDKW